MPVYYCFPYSYSQGISHDKFATHFQSNIQHSVKISIKSHYTVTNQYLTITFHFHHSEHHLPTVLTQSIANRTYIKYYPYHISENTLLLQNSTLYSYTSYSTTSDGMFLLVFCVIYAFHLNYLLMFRIKKKLNICCWLYLCSLIQIYNLIILRIKVAIYIV